LVVDWFVGSGTSAYEALKLSRNFIGLDIDCERLSRLRKEFDTLSTRLFCRDSTAIETATLLENNSIEFFSRKFHDLSILHPPYLDIIKFTDNQKDLSHCQDPNMFLTLFSQVAYNCHTTLKQKGFAALIIGDIYRNSQVYPLGFYCMQKMLDVGFKLKSIIIKNITGNERGKGKNLGLWKYRAEKGNFSLFKHEYIMVFQK
jgi:DNA modification methylase